MNITKRHLLKLSIYIPFLSISIFAQTASVSWSKNLSANYQNKAVGIIPLENGNTSFYTYTNRYTFQRSGTEKFYHQTCNSNGELIQSVPISALYDYSISNAIKIENSKVALTGYQNSDSTEVLIILSQNNSVEKITILPKNRKFNHKTIKNIDDGSYLLATLDSSIIKIDTEGSEIWSYKSPYQIQEFAVNSYNEIVMIAHYYTDTLYYQNSAGSMLSYSDNIIKIIKITPLGTKVWEQEIDGPFADYAYGITATPSNNWIITGGFNSTKISIYNTKSSLGIIHLNNEGIISWQKTYGAENKNYGSIIKMATDSTFVIGGTYKSSFSPVKNGHKSSAWLLHCNLKGDTINTIIDNLKSYVSAISNIPGKDLLISFNYQNNTFSQYSNTLEKKHNLSFDNSENYGYEYYFNATSYLHNKTFTVGHTSIFGNGKNDIMLTIYDNVNNIKNTILFGDAEDDYATDIVSKDSTLLITGSLNNSLWVSEIDINGDTLWSRSYGNSSIGHSITTMNDGAIILGCIKSESENTLWILRINDYGDTLWTQKYEGLSFDTTLQIDTFDKGLAFAVSNNNTVTIFITDSIGNMLSEKSLYYDIKSFKLNSKGFVLGGYTGDNGLVIQLDSTGNEIWKYEISNEDTCKILNIALQEDGSILFAGKLSRTFYANHIYHISKSLVGKIDSSGNLIWQLELDINNGNNSAVDIAKIDTDKWIILCNNPTTIYSIKETGATTDNTFQLKNNLSVSQKVIGNKLIINAENKIIKNSTLKIFSISGKLLKEIKFENEREIVVDLYSLSSGFYVSRVNIGQNKFCKKFIIK